MLLLGPHLRDPDAVYQRISHLYIHAQLFRYESEGVSTRLVGEAGITLVVANGGRRWKRRERTVAGPRLIG
jgi:hypothetical protein